MRIVVTVMLCVSAASTPLSAQTGQWSQPTTTERWSEAPAKPAPSSPAPTAPGTTEIWSSPTYTKQVDPRSMEEPEVLEGKPLQAGLAGSWDLWVPGGIWYSSDGTSVYRNYTPGAAMNRLSIASDGSYRWAGFRGSLVEVKPWFAQEGQRYFAVQMDGENKYMARLDPADGKLRLFFWGVGGHAATGTKR